MSLFKFHVHSVARDLSPCVIDLPDLEAARGEALRLAGEMIRDSAYQSTSDGRWQVEVINEAGLNVLQLEFVMVETLVAKLGTR